MSDETGFGGIAQLEEHLLCKQGVSGSSPLTSTTAALEIKGSDDELLISGTDRISVL